MLKHAIIYIPKSVSLYADSETPNNIIYLQSRERLVCIILKCRLGRF